MINLEIKLSRSSNLRTRGLIRDRPARNVSADRLGIVYEDEQVYVFGLDGEGNCD